MDAWNVAHRRLVQAGWVFTSASRGSITVIDGIDPQGRAVHVMVDDILTNVTVAGVTSTLPMAPDDWKDADFVVSRIIEAHDATR